MNGQRANSRIPPSRWRCLHGPIHSSCSVLLALRHELLSTPQSQAGGGRLAQNLCSDLTTMATHPTYAVLTSLCPQGSRARAHWLSQQGLNPCISGGLGSWRLLPTQAGSWNSGRRRLPVGPESRNRSATLRLCHSLFASSSMPSDSRTLLRRSSAASSMPVVAQLPVYSPWRAP